WPGNIRELKKFVDLLVEGGAGRVDLPIVERLLKMIRVQESEASFVTDDQYRLALAQGLDEAVERFIDTVIKRNLAANDGKKSTSRADLRSAALLLSPSLNRFDPGLEEPAA